MEYNQGAGWNSSAFPSAANKQQIPVILKWEPGLENSL